MSRPTTHFLALVLYLAASAWACADDLADLARPRQGVLVLLGGQVLEGEVTQAGDNYYLTLPTGEISIRAADVAFRCQDLGEAYLRRRENVNPARVEERIKLVEWCLQYDLYGAAAREIAEAKAQWPGETRLAALERRMLLRDRTVPSSDTGTARSAEPSFDELDEIVRRLPPRATAMFTNTIQPLLLNQCATAACHGASRKNDFGLQRAQVTHTPSRRLTLRNLGHTLAQIDRQHPDVSPLITQPSGLEDSPHQIVFSDPHSAGYKDLIAWVRLVAGEEQHETPAAGPRADSALMQFAPPGTPGANNSGGTFATAGKTRKQVASVDSARQTPDLTFSTNQRGGLIRPDGSYDPVDPDVFNRRHFPDRFEATPSVGQASKPADALPEQAN